MKEIYVSTDVETDGPIPGMNSMLSFGSVALNADGLEIGYFTRNISVLPDAVPDPDTTEWWNRNQEAWEECRKGLIDPEIAMKEYVAWLEALPGKPVFVGYPASFDFMFVYWYLIKFAGRSPFSFYALDMKTFAMAILMTDFKDTVKKNMPEDWICPEKHTHIALEDAREQGQLFMKMFRVVRADR